jgi:16S rRNA (guanine966-N2)-methyltransferase
VRVIAGSLRGRELVTPAGDSTRPTAARVREALFSILGDVSGLVVLDLYAGSGALAIEALSRGAASAVLVEQNRGAQRAIRENLHKLGLADRALLLPVPVASALRGLAAHAPFGLVFADPPWADAQGALSLLSRGARLALFAPAARLALEHAARRPLAIEADTALNVIDERSWGDTAVTIFEPRAE